MLQLEWVLLNLLKHLSHDSITLYSNEQIQDSIGELKHLYYGS